MVLSRQSLKKVIGGAKPMIIAQGVSLEDHLQPASLDLPIGDRCYRMPVSGAPKGGESVEDLIRRYSKFDFEIKSEGSRLERGSTYIIPLAVELDLAKEFRARFSAKSTTGRNGIFSRNLSDGNPKVDVSIFGYSGKLFIELSQLRFETNVYPGMPVSQLRIESDKAVPLTTEQLRVLDAQYGLVRDENGEPKEATIIDGALELHLDLAGEHPGYKSRINYIDAIHLGKREVDDRRKFWRTVTLTDQQEVILQPSDFYLFYTKERVYIPPCVCAYMEDYSANMGEFSSHEAGFFDNSFGAGGGTKGVLEVHPSRIPIRFWDGRPVCRMVFYKTDEVPDVLYNGNYTGPYPKLAKNFVNFNEW